MENRFSCTHSRGLQLDIEGMFRINGSSTPDNIRDGNSDKVTSIARVSAGLFTVTLASGHTYPDKLTFQDAAIAQAANPTVKARAHIVRDTYSKVNRTFQIQVLADSVSGTGTAATGTITCATNANMTDGDYITIGDGVNPPVLYEYDKSANGVTAGRVNWAAGASTASDVAVTLKTAIEANQPLLTVVENAGVLTLTHKFVGTFANVTITENVTHASFTVAGMSGGTNAALVVADSASDADDNDQVSFWLRGPIDSIGTDNVT